MGIIRDSSIMDIVDSLVRALAIWKIAGMEIELIHTGQDGTFLLPVAFLCGVLAKGKLAEIVEAYKIKP